MDKDIYLCAKCHGMDYASWGYDEFICLVLIYVSHVDIEYSEVEAQKIKAGFNGDIYERVFTAFDKMSDYQSLETILSFREKYFPDEECKTKLLNEIKMQFFIDGEYSALEKEVFHFLEKMF